MRNSVLNTNLENDKLVPLLYDKNMNSVERQ